MIKKQETNYFILSSLKLPIYEKFMDISDHVGITGDLLYALLKNKNRFYTKIEIPRKNSKKMRIIYKPSFTLKIVQKFILNEILEKISTSKEAYAFKKDNKDLKEYFGIKYNAKAHIKNEYIYEFDIKDFFPSIKKKMIFYLFRNLGYNMKISNILSELCTLNGILPQGSVTAPYLSNLVCSELDRRLKEKCDSKGITYTRYADDLTFSSNDLEELKRIKSTVIEELKRLDLVLNEKKTRLMVLGDRRIVTGILIEKRNLYVKKELKRKVRSMIHQMIQNGDYSKLNQVKGYVSYISSIESNYIENTLEYIKKLIKKLEDIERNTEYELRILNFREHDIDYKKELSEDLANDLNSLKRKREKCKNNIENYIKELEKRVKT
ncbi:retron St85 family RNA-directed DNA polymerase [Cetobacterium somerae]